jgi:2,4-dienoyl-CoA reductase (NADPH2)
MVSMARPFLADPEFVNKAAQGRRDEINTCIACNQACLDHAFQAKLASCLVNPRAGHETELVIRIAPAKKRRRLIFPALPTCLNSFKDGPAYHDAFEISMELGPN